MSTTERGNWKNWFEFLFSVIGCMVGLGNIWRFPYLCYKNGGGAFLIPYFLFMFICAMPLMFLEMAYSQYSNLGPGRVWECCPLFKGIGVGMVVLTSIVSVYYNVILAWALMYLGMSFKSPIPWAHCDNPWNTPNCYMRTARSNISGMDSNNTIDNTTFQVVVENYTTTQNITNGYMVNQSCNFVDCFNNTITNLTSIRKTPAEEFWERYVLEISDGVEHPGTIRWQLFLCLLAGWTVVFLCLIKGIKTSGKVVYVAATVPYVLLIVLFIRGLMLPGAGDGIYLYIVPRWESLLQFSVWSDAAVQVFYSAGIGWGGIATLSSYNNFHNNCYRDAAILPIIDAVTSWFAGFVIFVTLGNMAYETEVTIDDVVDQGPGIAFMVFPEAVSRLPIPQLWSVFFFIMLFAVGIDSQFVHVQTLTTALFDHFPRQLMHRKLAVTAVICLALFLLGFSCITQGGIYVLQILDWYCASICVMLLAFLEVVALAWVYGVERLYGDIEMMIGYMPHRVWKIFWLFISPICIGLLWVVGVVKFTPVKYGNKEYPDWAIGIGWAVAMLPLIPTPVYFIRQLACRRGSLIQNLKKSTQPSCNWRPALQHDMPEIQPTLNETWQ